MALGTIVGFNAIRVTTTAATQITTVGTIVVARLASTVTNVQLDIHNGLTTSAASRVARLIVSLANEDDEIGVPIRCDAGVRVKLNKAANEAFIYIR